MRSFIHSFVFIPPPTSLLLQALRKRARASMRELRGRQAAACLEARSIERSWMSSLARWAGQLVKARAAAAGGEIGELRILQREDAEVTKYCYSSSSCSRSCCILWYTISSLIRNIHGIMGGQWSVTQDRPHSTPPPHSKKKISNYVCWVNKQARNL